VIIKNIIANVVEDSVRVSGAEGDAVILEVANLSHLCVSSFFLDNVLIKIKK
jgi:hypothetical protein